MRSSHPLHPACTRPCLRCGQVEVGRLHGDWVRSDGGIGVARSLRPVVLAALLGATGVKIEGNLITGSVPSADTKFSGGVVVTSSLGDSAVAPADNGVHGNGSLMAIKSAPPVRRGHEVPAEHGPHLARCLTWTATGPLTGFQVKAASLPGDLSGVWRWF